MTIMLEIKRSCILEGAGYGGGYTTRGRDVCVWGWVCPSVPRDAVARAIADKSASAVAGDMGAVVGR